MKQLNTLTATLGAALLTSVAFTAHAASNPFVAQELASGYSLAAAEKAQEVRSASLPEAMAAVAAAGEAGKEASKAMIATMGRAKTLGEQSIGHPDAGACSVVVILNAMRDYVLA